GGGGGGGGGRGGRGGGGGGGGGRGGGGGGGEPPRHERQEDVGTGLGRHRESKASGFRACQQTWGAGGSRRPGSAAGRSVVRGLERSLRRSRRCLLDLAVLRIAPVELETAPHADVVRRHHVGAAQRRRYHRLQPLLVATRQTPRRAADQEPERGVAELPRSVDQRAHGGQRSDAALVRHIRTHVSPRGRRRGRHRQDQRREERAASHCIHLSNLPIAASAAIAEQSRPHADSACPRSLPEPAN